MPLHLVQDDLDAGRLVLLKPRGMLSTYELSLRAMVRRGDSLGPVGRWLFEHPTLDAAAA